jgi:hypothetical protein
MSFFLRLWLPKSRRDDDRPGLAYIWPMILGHEDTRPIEEIGFNWSEGSRLMRTYHNTMYMRNDTVAVHPRRLHRLVEEPLS